MRYTITFCLLIISLNAFTQNIPAIDSMLSKGVMGCGIIRETKDPEKSKVIFLCRARTTNYNDREPLFIIDGILVEMRRLNDLDPNDIESIDILKDASATALYGCRALSGVIIITTKSASLRKFIIKDFLDGSSIPGATVTFISQDEKKDTLMFVANDSGMIATSELEQGKQYKAIITSVGYKDLSVVPNNESNKKVSEFKLEREMISCGEVIVSTNVLTRICSRISCGLSRVSVCDIINEKSIGEKNTNSDMGCKIYPNPVSKGTSVTIDIKSVADDLIKIKVVNLTGQTLISQSKQLMKGNNRILIQPGQNWTTGIYIVQLTDQTGKLDKSEKLIIQ